MAAYTTSKAAVAGLTRALAVEWARFGVTVNAIAPGVFETDLNRALLAGPRGRSFSSVRRCSASAASKLVGAAVFWRRTLPASSRASYLPWTAGCSPAGERVNAALVISARDNVATVLEPLEPGRLITLASGPVSVVDSIPRGHKMAIRSIRAGESSSHRSRIRDRVGRHPRGRARSHPQRQSRARPRDLARRENAGDAATPAARRARSSRRSIGRSGSEGAMTDQATFLGFPRPDGRTGVRNTSWSSRR